MGPEKPPSWKQYTCCPTDAPSGEGRLTFSHSEGRSVFLYTQRWLPKRTAVVRWVWQGKQRVGACESMGLTNPRSCPCWSAAQSAASNQVARTLLLEARRSDAVSSIGVCSTWSTAP